MFESLFRTVFKKTSWRELAYYVIIQLNTTDVI